MINLPAIKLYVEKHYLTNGVEAGLVEAYLMGADCRNGEAIRWTVYLASGAVWSGLPCEALWFYEEKEAWLDNEVLQPYTCL